MESVLAEANEFQSADLETSQSMLFKKFVKDFNKTYKTSEEFNRRYEIFKQNLVEISIAQKNEKGTAVYGITKFADMTQTEFSQPCCGRSPRISSMLPAKIPNVSMPMEFDWEDEGVVTPVKNQGMCGSSWASSATGNIEGQYAGKPKTLCSLSEQELVNCDKEDEGCNGGLPENAYDAIKNLGELETETDYLYEGSDGN